MAEPRIAALVNLRRQLLSTLKLVELQLSSEKPVCRHCFFSKGLTERCECGKPMVD